MIAPRSLLCPILVGLTIAGCGLQGTIVDRNLTEINAQNVRLAPVSRLKVLHGEAVRDIPLKAVQKVEIFPEDFVNFEGDVYYSCRVTLKSGEVIEPRSEKNKLSRTYVRVSSFLTGRGRDGRLRISLDNVSKFSVR